MSAMPMESPPSGAGQPEAKPLIKSRALYSAIATILLSLAAAFLPGEWIEEFGSERLHALLMGGVATAIVFLRAALARTEGAAAQSSQVRTPPPAALLALAALPFMGGCESYPDTRPAVAALDATISRLEGDYRSGKVRLRDDDGENAEALESRLSLIEKAHETARIATARPE